jgi:glycosyltransferase involved in cell wall biosynthesis
MPSEPAVSVCMPVYNTERYVAEAVESTLGQTFGDFEFIIIDDGSTDGSGEVLARYAAQDGRIRLFRRENRGIVASRNEGLGLATGEMIAVIDSDDVALPDRLAIQVGYLRAHPECVAVGGSNLVIDASGDPVCTWNHPRSHEEIDRSNIVNDQKMLHSSLVMRREAVLAVGGYRPEAETAEELDLLLRLAELGQLANVPDVVVKYRRHGSSVSHARRAHQVRASDFALRDARRRRGLDDSDVPARAATEARSPSASENHRLWAWWALSDRNASAARKHAWEALKQGPLDPETWRVVFCALRGY